MQLQDKVVNFLGDSITEGTGMQGQLQLRYHQIVKRELGLKEANIYGIGGSRLAHQMRPSARPRWDLCFVGRADTMDVNADMVVVYGGVNDWIHGDAPFGKWGDNTPDTFCGAVYYLMRFLKNTYANKPIIFMTPARCLFNGISSNGVSTHPYKHPDCKPLIEYVNVIKQTGETFQISVLDLYDGLGIDPNNEEDNKKYTVDGLHFNAAGHAAIAEYLKEFIQKL
jgi:lysophospholipase L1-like esterase